MLCEKIRTRYEFKTEIMASNHVLVFWTKSKKISTVLEGSFVKSFDENGDELPISEGAIRTVSIGNKHHEAKILRICCKLKFKKACSFLFM